MALRNHLIRVSEDYREGHFYRVAEISKTAEEAGLSAIATLNFIKGIQEFVDFDELSETLEGTA